MKFQTSVLALLLACGGWAEMRSEEAAADRNDGQLINSLYQREWVRINENGGVSGRVVLIDRNGNKTGSMDNKVVLAKDGVIAYQTETESDGSFEFKSVAPGAYALQASGDYTMAAFALHVMPANADHLASNIDVFTTTLGSRVREIIGGNVIPADLEVGADDYYRTHETDPIADNRAFSRDHQVVLQGGDLIGRVSRPGWTFAEQDLSGSVAQVIKNGEVIAKAAVSKDGQYRIESLLPGVYDMVITGSDGFAAFRFQAVDQAAAQDESVASKSSDVTYVSARLVNTVVADSLNSELIHQSDVYASPMPVESGMMGCENGDCGMVMESVGCGQAPCCGGGYAGGGGFGGGGGGGGFGGGGFGGLLGLGGIAGGIVALATSGGGTPTTPTSIAP